MDTSTIVLIISVLAGIFLGLKMFGKKTKHYFPTSPGWEHYGRVSKKKVGKINLPAPNFRFGRAHMMTRAVPANYLKNKKIRAKFLFSNANYISGDFQGDEWKPKANSTPIVSLFLHVPGDNYSAKGEYNFYRWYSLPYVAIKPGEILCLEASIDSSQWTPVLHSADKDRKFNEYVNKSVRVGLCFGGTGTGRAHGVQAYGDGSFELISFEIVE